jgi:hypothetical protein
VAPGGSNIKGYVIGFLLGVLTTILFFYFEGWDYLARGGDKVERRMRRGVEHMTDDVKDASGGVKDKADEWIDGTFKK